MRGVTLGYKSGAPQISQACRTPPIQEGVQERLFSAFYSFAYQQGYSDANKKNAHLIIDTIKQKKIAATQQEIAKVLGIQQPVVSLFLNGKKDLDKAMLRKIVDTTRDDFKINPVYEYISVSPLKKGAGWYISSKPTERRKFREKLEAIQTGIYIFYSSTGIPSYVGMTTRNMFTEIEQRLKALIQSGKYGLNESGELKRYDHSGRKVKTGHKFQQGDVTRLLSVYEIKTQSKIIVKTIEALMIRSFINALENNQLQKFPK